MAFQGVRMLVAGIGLLSAHAALAQQYSLAVEGHLYSQARAINTAGQVAGDFYLGARPYIWDGNTFQELGPLPGTSNCRASAINDSGQVVGSCYGYYPSVARKSFLWSADTGMTALPIPDWSGATGINNQGHIVGWMSDPENGAPVYAFLYRDGMVENLGPGEARGINDHDQVVGYASNDSAAGVARLWDTQGPHDLDDEGGSSVAYAISAEGIVAGESTRGRPHGSPSHAVLWTPFGISDLGTLGGFYSAALAIRGNLVVGNAETASRATHAFLYDTNGPGSMIDLNDVIAPSRYRLDGATGINEAGQITGGADCCGESQAFLLTPVQPAPPPR